MNDPMVQKRQRLLNEVHSRCWSRLSPWLVHYGRWSRCPDVKRRHLSRPLSHARNPSGRAQ